MINFLQGSVRFGLIAVLALYSAMTLAQSNPSVLDLTTITDTPVSFTVNSSSQPGVSIDPADGSVVLLSANGDSYEIQFTPTAGFTGEVVFVVRYYSSIPFPPFFAQHNILVTVLVGDAIIEAADDYVVVGPASTYIVEPLVNDTSSAPGLRLEHVAISQYGDATVTGSTTLEYTVPVDDRELDYVIYTTTDDVGGHGYATVYFARSAVNPDPTGDLSFTIGNTEKQVVKLPDTQFTLSSGANLGSVDYRADGMVIEYTPNTNVVGQDTLLFSNTAGISRTVYITINDYATLPLVIDDVVHTTVNSSITFDAFANDNMVGNVVLDSYSSELTNDSLGIFSYTPPVGFFGLKEFYYTVDDGFGFHEAKVSVFIGDQEPRDDIAYAFSTPKDNLLVLDYEVDVEGYSLAIQSGPLHGSAAAYNNAQIYSTLCGDVSATAYVIYHPQNGYVGEDSLTITYCTASGVCKDYDIAIEVYDFVGSDCKCLVDCVWEGDANNDGRISVRDVLPIARAMGQGGLSRNDIDYGTWEAQSMEDWDMYLPDGTNYKHADTDGNGVITASDVDVVATRYDDVHTLVPTDLLDYKQYPLLLIPQFTTVDSGDLVVFDIVLGSSQYPVQDLQGLAFGLNINAGLADSASMEIFFFEDSWFAANGNILQLDKTPKDGRIEAALGKANGNNGNGYGVVGQLSFIVEDEAEGFKDNGLSDTRQVRVTTEDVMIEDEQGRQYLLPSTQSSVTLRLDRSKDALKPSDLILFPNPVEDRLRMHLNGGHKMHEVAVYDAVGARLMRMSVNDNGHTIDVQNLMQGVYILEAQTDGGVISQKFIKL